MKVVIPSSRSSLGEVEFSLFMDTLTVTAKGRNKGKFEISFSETKKALNRTKDLVLHGVGFAHKLGSPEVLIHFDDFAIPVSRSELRRAIRALEVE